ncbi:molybdopterin-guanine dinucleotide biosynthesis protein BA [Lentisphaera araneosa HTCC2155]|uniref:Probable molybdenum cofactor guanylyltransferase n=1 Tax=Lentisphaera araneosa HTCC2155 TaxID=313628 RepID=A6DT44_9BACT|nr:molybdopterin-guanine dinucleotide biosynthesis protein MobB [Lentisphaera araneosa]EDM25219.1 molybdopterin-guanine dinucleotide biosynthesis protein BA [Lentisphaera araneosa HTCC2155]
MSKNHHRGGLPWLFNPFEIKFSAYSGSGKTTLICRLINEMCQDFDIAYAKSDAHRFEMDKPRKDTHQAQMAGAQAVVINNPEARAKLEKRPANEIWRSLNLLEYDLVFVEGYKNHTQSPRVLLVNEKMLKEIADKDLENVIAFAGPAKERPEGLPLEVPYLHRDDIPAIKEIILETFKTRIPKTKGLVLVGGKSRRMGEDKASMQFGDKSMARQAYELLKTQCDEVYLSVRDENQELPEDCLGLPIITDQLKDMGPTGGILSAFKKDSTSAWTVMGCDLPLVNQDAIEKLYAGRNAQRYATCFKSNSDDMPEPLFAIYEPKAQNRFYQFLATNRLCPRKVLLNSSIELLEQGEYNYLDNANTPEDAQRIIEELNR